MRRLAREYVDFLRTQRRWWAAPILLFLLLLSALAVYGSGALAPFLYPLI